VVENLLRVEAPGYPAAVTQQLIVRHFRSEPISGEQAVGRARAAFAGAWRSLPVGTVKINAAFGGAPGGAAQPRGASGTGFGYGPELLDELTTTKVVHWSPPGGCPPPD
jgi:hypothetical protein